MSSTLDKIYNISPVFLQNLMVSVFGAYWHWLRFGGSYSKYESGYRERESNTREEWTQYQLSAVNRIIQIAWRHVPYYRKKWSSDQVNQALNGNLQVLPLTEKDDIRANPYDFVRDDQRRMQEWTFHTSGTTGTPVATKWIRDENRDSLAVREVRSANWAGVSFNDPRATISGRMVEPDPTSNGPYYRYNCVEKQVYFSAFHIRPDTAEEYIAALTKHKVEWLTGYAVSYYLLAKFILEKKLVVPPLKAIITTSEKLTQEMRKVMEKAYHCRIYEEYSTVENALFASECEHGRLHVSPDVAIVEILRPDGSICNPGEVGEVVTTCLMRTHQPLIRFRLGDLAAWDSEPCPCGRNMPVIKEVVGRIEDIVIGPDGRQLVRFHGIFVDQPNVIEGQIIQENRTDFLVRIVASKDFSEKDEREIEKRMHQRLGDNANIRVERVTAIPRGKSGKFKAVISKVPNID